MLKQYKAFLVWKLKGKPPLNVLQGTMLPENFRKKVKQINDTDIDPTIHGKFIRELKKASKIIENLLKFARPSALKEKERVNIETLVCDSLDLVENEAKIQKIEIIKSIPDEMYFIKGNMELLQQVLVNINRDIQAACDFPGAVG